MESGEIRKEINPAQALFAVFPTLARKIIK